MAKIIAKRSTNFQLCLTERDFESTLKSFCKCAKKNGGYGIDTETGGLDWTRDPLYMISLYTGDHPAVVVPLAWPEGKIRMTRLKSLIAPLVEDERLNAYLWNAKFDMHFLANADVHFHNHILDASVMAHLINNELPRKLKLRAKLDLGMIMNMFDKLFNLTRGKTLVDYPLDVVARYAADDAIATYRLAMKYMSNNPDISSKTFSLNGSAELGTLFRKIEVPITRTLFKMERLGVTADVPKIEAYGKHLEPILEKALVKAYKLVGAEFNMNSPKQLLPILQNRGFRDLQSTGEAELLKAFAHRKDPLLKVILEYREAEKIRGTYVEAMLSKMDREQVIHTTFNQGGTDTGRFSSSGPNLQNIPREGAIREFFRPRSGCVFIVRDYGQVELRVAAHASGDPVMIKEFQDGLDIHSVGAAGIFGKSIEDVTPEERQAAKATTSFGVLFGMSPDSLALKLGVTSIKAEAFIANWFKKYRGVDTFFKRLVESSLQTGFVQTFLGRTRFIEALKSPKSKGAHNAAIREVKNTAIQGAAADLVKLGMLACDTEELHQLGVRLLLQVHDEFVFEVPEDNAYRANLLISNLMINFPVAKKLLVPLTTDGGIGRNWHEAKEGGLNERFAELYG
jgi:DNA polymerase I